MGMDTGEHCPNTKKRESCRLQQLEGGLHYSRYLAKSILQGGHDAHNGSSG